MTTETSQRRRPAAAPLWAGALAGLLAAATGVAIGSGLAALLTGVPTPIESVGNQFIDLTPAWLKDFAIEQFGTNDKAVLIAGTVIVLTIASLVAGVIGRRHPRIAFAIVATFGIVAVITAFTDRTATAPRALVLVPALVTLIVSLVVLGVLLRALELAPKPGDDVPEGFDRRAFMRAVLIASAGIAAGASVWRFLGSDAGAASRESVSLPAAADPAPPVPAGVQVDLDGISPYITPNSDFYRIDTALQVPQVPVEGYTLRIHGMVDQELNLSFRDLLAERLVERRITLTCVSNEVGGPLVGNAAWLGVLTKDLLERAGVQSGADAVKTTSSDGMTIGTPVEALLDDRESLIAVGMNGEPLPLQHGFPVRMVVPGLYGYVSATKWLVDIEVTRFADFEAYWTPRGYAEEAPIKMSSRVDVPRSFGEVPIDNARFGGVAWAQDTGIERVEVSVDDGPWEEAELAAQDTINTWRQWSYTWDDATEGNHQVTVRATDANGETQTSDRARIVPDGTTGWHSVQFRVA